MTTELFSMLLSGNIVQAIVTSYTNVMSQWFYGFIFFIGFFLIYMKTEDFGTVGITGLITSVTLLRLIPVETTYIAWLMLALSLTCILYKVFK